MHDGIVNEDRIIIQADYFLCCNVYGSSSCWFCGLVTEKGTHSKFYIAHTFIFRETAVQAIPWRHYPFLGIVLMVCK